VSENRVLRRIYGKECKIRSLTQYYKGGHIKKDEMGMTCSIRGRDEKCIQSFGWKTCMEETTQNALAQIGRY
jgi:hypothetical protein